MVTGELHTKFCDDRFSSSRDMLADRHRQTGRSQYSGPIVGRSNNEL